MEKLFESVMKEHGAWIRMEVYELTGDESEIKSIIGVFARTEELLNTTLFDQYGALLSVLETALGSSAITAAALPPASSRTTTASSDAIEESSTPGAVRRASRGAVDNGNPLKNWFEKFVEQTENPAEEMTPQALYEKFVATAGIDSMHRNTFWKSMNLFNVRCRIKDGYSMYTHIRVRSVEEVYPTGAMEAMVATNDEG